MGPIPLANRHVHIVEDDERIRAELVAAVEAAGANSSVSCYLSEAVERLSRETFDLVILDLGLPDGDGTRVCRFLRDQGRSDPVIILTARGRADQKVRGLDSGADDYVTKPFEMSELLARMRTVLRRSSTDLARPELAVPGLRVDIAGRRVTVRDETVSLTRKEFDLLVFLMRHPGRVWTRDVLLERVWANDDPGDTRTVDLHVRRLRMKLEQDPKDPKLIETVWGVGYAFRANEEDVS